MTSTNHSIAEVKRNAYIFPLFSSLAITFTLFFIDEGYYDLRWMADTYNWFVFAFYVGGLFLGQALVATFFFANLKGALKQTITLGLGLPVGLICIVTMMYSLALLQAIWSFSTNMT